MHPLILRPEVEAEVEDAYRWYDKQSPGLGAEFVRVVDAAFESIQREPEVYPVKYRGARQVVLRRFPYTIFFIIHPSASIEVISCFHTSRNPRRWRSRV